MGVSGVISQFAARPIRKPQLETHGIIRRVPFRSEARTSREPTELAQRRQR